MIFLFFHQQQVRLHLALALDLNASLLLPSKVRIALHQDVQVLRDLQPSHLGTRGLHAARRVHRVPKQAVPRHATPHHSGANITGVLPTLIWQISPLGMRWRWASRMASFPNAMAALAASESPMKLRTLTLAFLKLESPLLALCLLGTWNSIMMDVDSFPSLPSSNAKDSPDVMPSPEATMKASPI